MKIEISETTKREISNAIRKASTVNAWENPTYYNEKSAFRKGDCLIGTKKGLFAGVVIHIMAEVNHQYVYLMEGNDGMVFRDSNKWIDNLFMKKNGKTNHIAVSNTAYIVSLGIVKTSKNGDRSERMTEYLAVCHSSIDCKNVMMKEKERVMNRYHHKKNFGLDQTFDGDDASDYHCYLDITDSKGNCIEYFMNVDKVKEV